MAFSADELRVLRRALDIALSPHSVPAGCGPERQAEVRDCLRLAEALAEADRESGRLRAFLLADLSRYRSALPGAAPGYVERLRDALAEGYRPGPEDLAALRSLCTAPSGDAEALRRRELLRHCERLAETAVRARLAVRAAGAVPEARPELGRPRQAADADRGHHLAGAGLEAAGRPGDRPGPPTKPAPGPPPAAPQPKPSSTPKSPRPDRPIPTPGEVFPPRRKPAPPTTALTASRRT
ncbi:hypothetical protein BLA24_11120 [Streptomyces cinnamoneus]|uniref:Uncharacterized protein n=2 Tax=Streptomyces cinnamoneus TaxID=53446 RepID=A0A2G1XKX6_STRCJ|nr:hypothetical protein BLA24_11120 [Streptomyces cinnamoneus]PPT14309.1 hypothetical protein CYQ11_16835 [Streptomyces cinnamoneus]